MASHTSVSGALEAPGLKWYLAATRPEPVLALLGGSPLHKTIVDHMSQCKRDYPDVAFNLRQLPSEDAIRRKKDRKSYEGYVPQGLFKADWCRKHQEDVYGCVMLVVSLDGVASREAFESSTEDYVERVKRQLRGRASKLLVLVTTSAERLPFYEKPEACQSFVRKRCDLDSQKHVALLHASRGVPEGVKRVLQIATDLAQNYYREEARRVKKLKETAHRLLQPRHRFKVAYYFEVQRQTELSLKYYGQCYDALRAISSDSVPALEIKSAAEVVMFRMSLIKFLHEDVCKIGAAVKSVREHMSWFRLCCDASQRAGPRGGVLPLRSTASAASTSVATADSTASPTGRKHLVPTSPTVNVNENTSAHSGSTSGNHLAGGYTGAGGSLLIASEEQMLSTVCGSEVLLHHVSVARQCESFGWLIHRAVATQPTTNDGGEYANPGYHYHCAALAVEARKTFVRRIPPPSSAPADVKESAFLGQLWAADHIFLPALLQNEETVPYEEEVVTLCLKARDAYASRGYTIMNHSLSVLMAKCHVGTGRWEDAQKCLAEPYVFFKATPWPTVTADILRYLMTCSVKLRKLDEYLKALLEFVSAAPDAPEKLILFQNVLLWLGGGPAQGQADDLRAVFFKPPEASPVLPVDIHHPFLSITARFSSPFVSAHEECFLKIQLATKAGFAIPVRRVRVGFTQAALDFEHELDETSAVSREKPTVLKLPVAFKAATTVKLKSISIDCGAICLSRSIVVSSELLTRLSEAGPPSAASRYPFAEEAPGDIVCSSFVDRPAIRVLKPEPVLTLRLEHEPPVLVNESYPVKLIVSAGSEAVEKGVIKLPGGSDCQLLQARREGGGEVLMKQSSDASSEAFEGKVSMSYELPLGSGIPAGEEHVYTLVVRFGSCGEHPMPIVVQYATKRSSDMQVVLPVDLRVVVPFHICVTASDTVTWLANGSRSNVPNPHRRARYWLNSNTPAKEKKDAAAKDDAAAAQRKEATSELARLGVNNATVTPFTVATTKVHKTDVSMRYQQPVVLTVAAICNVASFDIEVKAFSLKLNNTVEVVRAPHTESMRLCETEEVAYTWLLLPVSDAWITGQVLVEACRVGSAESILFPLQLPPVAVERVPVLPTFEVPSAGVVGEVLNLTVHLTNTCENDVKEVVCEVHDNDREMEKRFLWSGRSSFTVFILPMSTAAVEYHLIPVFPGYVTLPSMSMRVKGHPQVIVAPMESASIFIGPCCTSFKAPRNLISNRQETPVVGT